jgi:hypothetical protein
VGTHPRLLRVDTQQTRFVASEFQTASSSGQAAWEQGAPPIGSQCQAAQGMMPYGRLLPLLQDRTGTWSSNVLNGFCSIGMQLQTPSTSASHQCCGFVTSTLAILCLHAGFAAQLLLCNFFSCGDEHCYVTSAHRRFTTQTMASVTQ